MNTHLTYKIFKPADSASALPLRLAAGVIIALLILGAGRWSLDEFIVGKLESQ